MTPAARAHGISNQAGTAGARADAGSAHDRATVGDVDERTAEADDRTTITAAFGVPVIDMFASTEGLVGHSDPGGSVLTFATDMCIVEPVDAENQPLADGPLRPGCS